MPKDCKIILVFDLDDTLYDEKTYVLSGFRAVAAHLKRKYRLNSDKTYNFMLKDLKANGRGKIFNNILSKYSLENKKRIRELLSVYRKHKPKMKLFGDSERILNRFKNLPLYVVTDGNVNVQSNKCRALKLEKYVDKIFITYRYGIENAKPSTHCFKKILKLENSNPENLVYIADNPKKDFVNLNSEGYKTIRIMRGMFKDFKAAKGYDAKHRIKSLDEITTRFINSLITK
ncbi:MAG: HAD family hydrolase [Ignavibacteriae bacterium]|nr:HAD family hydrolase [Ignavibacteriota bacterium]